MNPRRLLLGAWLAAIGLSASCGKEQGGSSAGSPAPAPAAPAAVELAAVKSQKLDATVALPGELAPYEIVNVAAKVSGYVSSILVDRGSMVKKGQVLVRLEAPELAAQRAEAQAKLQAARAQLLSAQAKVAADESTLSHLREAAKTTGVVAGNDLVLAEKAADASRAAVTGLSDSVTAANEVVRAVSEQEAYLTIEAPFDGVVTERSVHPGDLVGPMSGHAASGLLRIETLSHLRLIVAVPQAFALEVSQSTAVRFTVAEAPGESFTAPIARVAHAVDPKTRTMPVELDVQNSSGRLTPGAFAQVDWPVRRPQPTLFVPATAVTSNLERTFVIRVRNGEAEWVDVRPGASAGTMTEVFGALHEGDQVVARATDAIRPGTKVH